MLRSMLRDTVTYTLPAMLSQGLGVILLPIYARVLTRDEFGAMDLILAVAPIITVVMSLEIQQGLSRLRVDADPEERRRMTGTAWIANACGLLVFVVLGLSAASPLGVLLFGREGLSTTVRLGVLSIGATAVYNVVLGQFRWELRSRTYAAVSALYAVLTLALTATLTVVVPLGLTGVLLSQTLSGVLATVAALLLLRGSWRPVVDRSHLRSMLAFSLPLIPASLSVFVTLYFNRVALRYFGNLGEVASYGMAARVAGFVGLLIVGMQSAVTPLIYNHFREKETPNELAHMFNGVIGLCIAICVALNAFAADILRLFAGHSYLSSAPLVALIAPALLTGQLYVFAPGISIGLKTRAQLGVAVAAAVVDIIANVALVPGLGAFGGAVATVISSSTFLALWIRASQRYYPIPFEYRRIIMALGLFAGLSVLAAIVRSSTVPLEAVGLTVKLAVALGTLALLYRVHLFTGVIGVLRGRPTASAVDPSARTSG